MTLFDALPKDTEGNIEIPIGAKDEAGNIYPGIVDADWLQSVFADYINLTVPLTEAQFTALKNHVAGNWPLNWQVFRDQGLI